MRAFFEIDLNCGVATRPDMSAEVAAAAEDFEEEPAMASLCSLQSFLKHAAKAAATSWGACSTWLLCGSGSF